MPENIEEETQWISYQQSGPWPPQTRDAIRQSQRRILHFECVSWYQRPIRILCAQWRELDRKALCTRSLPNSTNRIADCIVAIRLHHSKDSEELQVPHSATYSTEWSEVDQPKVGNEQNQNRSDANRLAHPLIRKWCSKKKICNENEIAWCHVLYPVVYILLLLCILEAGKWTKRFGQWLLTMSGYPEL